MSLDDYIKRMGEKQEFIYFICGEDRKIMKDSTFIQKLKHRGIEVLLLDDPIDEYTMQNLAEYEKKKTKNVAKGDLKLDTEADVKAKRKALRKMYKPLIDWWKAMLDKKANIFNYYNIYTQITLITVILTLQYYRLKISLFQVVLLILLS